MEDPQEDPLAVHCFYVCSGSALLGDFLGLADPGNVIFHLSCRFILGFSCVYSFRLLVGFLFVILFSTIRSCVLVVLV